MNTSYTALVFLSPHRLPSNFANSVCPPPPGKPFPFPRITPGEFVFGESLGYALAGHDELSFINAVVTPAGCLNNPSGG